MDTWEMAEDCGVDEEVARARLALKELGEALSAIESGYGPPEV
jgi:hypothetical protein